MGSKLKKIEDWTNYELFIYLRALGIFTSGHLQYISSMGNIMAFAAFTADQRRRGENICGYDHENGTHYDS